ncbi:hypothetical protein N752_05770 [Desulforamulus aquiferis]|nr:hypothetical protein N752_05770 [Desulforamulus aquiferis]
MGNSDKFEMIAKIMTLQKEFKLQRYQQMPFVSAAGQGR